MVCVDGGKEEIRKVESRRPECRVDVHRITIGDVILEQVRAVGAFLGEVDRIEVADVERAIFDINPDVVNDARLDCIGNRVEGGADAVVSQARSSPSGNRSIE